MKAELHFLRTPSGRQCLVGLASDGTRILSANLTRGELSKVVLALTNRATYLRNHGAAMLADEYANLGELFAMARDFDRIHPEASEETHAGTIGKRNEGSARGELGKIRVALGLQNGHIEPFSEGDDSSTGKGFAPGKCAGCDSPAPRCPCGFCPECCDNPSATFR